MYTKLLKAWEERNRLRAEARKLWGDALAKHCPTASVEWDDGSCTVAGGMHFLAALRK